MTPRLCLIASIVSIFLYSCASFYKPINPSTLNYPPVDNDTLFSYKYNVLKMAGNKKLAKKEDKYNIRIVAIKIVNNSKQTLRHGFNYNLYFGNQQVNIIDPAFTAGSIKQSVPVYLLYLLLTPLQFNISDGTSSNSIPVGLVIGPGIAAGNMIVAGSANKKFRNELFENSIIGRDIKAGETFYGLIGITDNSYMPITIKISGKN